MFAKFAVPESTLLSHQHVCFESRRGICSLYAHLIPYIVLLPSCSNQKALHSSTYKHACQTRYTLSYQRKIGYAHTKLCLIYSKNVIP